MIHKFRLTAKDTDDNIIVNVEINVRNHTQWESRDRKRRAINRFHATLREMGYDVTDIKVK